MADMSAELGDAPTFLVDGLISAALTVVYGQPKVGKSVFLTQLTKALTDGSEFLGHEVIGGPKTVAFVTTDLDGHAEFIERYEAFGGDCADVLTADGDITMPLVSSVTDHGADVVIIDNLDGLLPDNADLNSREGVKPTLRELKRLSAKVPVILVHHTAKDVQTGRTPAGSQFIRTNARALLRLELTTGGRHRVEVEGNRVMRQRIPLSLVDENGGPVFVVAGEADEVDKRKQSRNATTYDRNAEIGKWVSVHCPNESDRESARRVAGKFGGSSEHHRKVMKTYRNLAA